ncbi:hypothetical protein HBI56_036550 [Parastagonospora nodorum]|nr:hypothetical protein HBH56_070250 [Parastagonospora nodorum]KAH3932475.1 hypothetical protein HBH54_077870 [Parastagonospora nodorum]KAH3954893.1 hypothetical protein HBH53_016500 [Parastagonospora nodorum]KAH3986017.1 hypothetical protein HBH52_047650 [Parastagonospora nodorum]KAH3988272.1 hypothetical protein HBH51_001430 [Parastagonospora nodorum]
MRTNTYGHIIPCERFLRRFLHALGLTADVEDGAGAGTSAAELDRTTEVCNVLGWLDAGNAVGVGELSNEAVFINEADLDAVDISTVDDACVVLVVCSADVGFEDYVEEPDIDADAEFESDEAMMDEDAIEDAPIDRCTVELRDTPAEVEDTLPREASGFVEPACCTELLSKVELALVMGAEVPEENLNQ